MYVKKCYLPNPIIPHPPPPPQKNTHKKTHTYNALMYRQGNSVQVLQQTRNLKQTESIFTL